MTRFRVVTGPPDLPATSGITNTSSPTAGGVVHAIRPSDLDYWPGVPQRAEPGHPARVEAGGSFSDEALLATDGQGRAVQATTGDMIVAKALEAGTSGTVGWVVLEPQREL